TASTSRGRRQRDRRNQPALERLEDRTLLSIFNLGPLRFDGPFVHSDSLKATSANVFHPGKGVDICKARLQRWDQLLVGTWYVPAPNLLAYLFGPAGVNPVPIADQTIFHITRARSGVFSGDISVQISRPTALGWL